MYSCGLTGRQATPRGLRHALGVRTLQSGVPLSLVQRWLGHARMSTTAIYADGSGPEEVAFAAKFWNGPVGPCRIRGGSRCVLPL
jgi:integrase/recombinase XerD